MPEAIIVASDPGDLTRPAIAALEAAGHRVAVLPAGLTGEDVAARARGARVLLAGIVPLPANAIGRLEGIELIVRCGVGVDAVDVPAATARGVWVANVPDYCVDEVADHTLLLLLAAVRRLERFRAQLDAGRWTDLEYPPVRRLRGRVLGLLGFGRIGAAVAARATAFGLTVIAHDPVAPAGRLHDAHAEPVSLEALLGRSDILSLHCPLTPETRHIVGRAALERVQPGLVLVNTSRGALVDLDALAEAMGAGRVAAAGLDVLDGEPDPDLRHALLARADVIATPHVAFYSTDAQAELGRRILAEVERFLAGHPPTTLVNPTARTGA